MSFITHPTLPASAETNKQVFTTAWGTFDRYLLEANAKHSDIGGTNEINLKLLIQKVDPTASSEDLTKSYDAKGYLMPYGDDIAKLIESNVLPQMGETLDVSFPYGVGKMWEGEARLREMNVTTGPVGTLQVDLHYTTMYQLPPIECPYSAGTTSIMLDLPITFETTSSLRTIHLFRSVDWTVNAPPRDLDASTADIGGSPSSPVGSANVDVQTPIVFDVPQMRIRIRMIKDTTFDGSDKVTQIQSLSSYIGRRNSEPFLGFEKNTLWCEGASSQPIDHNFYELVMDLVADLYYEHSQIPEMAGDNKPYQTPEGNCETVYWNRPVRLDADFNGIFGDPVNDQMKELVSEGWWEYWSRAADGTSDADGVTTGLC